MPVKVQVNAYVWNPYARAYVPVSGKPIDTEGQRDVVAEVRKATAERMAEWATKLKDGDVTNLTEFSLGLKDEIKKLFLTTHILARGGVDQMDNSSWGKLGTALKEQYEFINSMVRDLENGKIGLKDSNGDVIMRESGVPELSDGFINRVEMYTESAWGGAGEFEGVVRDRESEFGSLERRILGESIKSCDDCIEAANMGWQPAGLLPDIGDTECGPGCNCTFEFENKELDDLNQSFGREAEKKALDSLETYALERLGASLPHCEINLAGIDGDLLILVSDRLSVFAQEFAGPASLIKKISMIPLEGQVLAQTRTNTFGDSWLVFNSKLWSDAYDLAYVLMVTIGGDSISTSPLDTGASTIDHELAHVLDTWIEINDPEESKGSADAVWATAVAPAVSRYANAGPAESFAEAFAVRQLFGIDAVIDAGLQESLQRAINFASGITKSLKGGGGSGNFGHSGIPGQQGGSAPGGGGEDHPHNPFNQHASTRVIKYMAKQGYSKQDIIKTLDHFGVKVSPATIQTQFWQGKNNVGEPANLTGKQKAAIKEAVKNQEPVGGAPMQDKSGATPGFTKEGRAGAKEIASQLKTSNAAKFKAENQKVMSAHLKKEAKNNPALAKQLIQVSKHWDANEGSAWDPTPTRSDAQHLEQGAKVAGRVLQDSWAQSSTDSNPDSIALQIAVGKKFGLSPEAEKSLYKNSGKQKIDKEFLDEVLRSGLSQKTLDSLSGKSSKSVWEISQAIAKTPLIKSYVEKTYELTQAQLKSAGIKEVTVVRGMGGFSHMSLGIRDVALNPLSSFSTSDSVASRFGATLFVTTVPASKVFSYPRTGPGCTEEKEVVVIGGVVRSNVTTLGGAFYKGGAGSGNFGHAGVVGQQGGSAPGGGGEGSDKEEEPSGYTNPTPGKVMGHAPTAMIRYMAKMGYTKKEIIKVLEHHGIPVHKGTLQTQMHAGKTGKGPVPTLTPEQQMSLVYVVHSEEFPTATSQDIEEVLIKLELNQAQQQQDAEYEAAQQQQSVFHEPVDTPAPTPYELEQQQIETAQAEFTDIESTPDFTDTGNEPPNGWHSAPLDKAEIDWAMDAGFPVIDNNGIVQPLDLEAGKYEGNLFFEPAALEEAQNAEALDSAAHIEQADLVSDFAIGLTENQVQSYLDSGDPVFNSKGESVDVATAHAIQAAGGELYPYNPIQLSPDEITIAIENGELLFTPDALDLGPHEAQDGGPVFSLAATGQASLPETEASAPSKITNPFEDHASTGVVRWMGKNGYSFDQAKMVLDYHGIKISDATVRAQLSAGKTGARGEPPALSVEHINSIAQITGGKVATPSQGTKPEPSTPKDPKDIQTKPGVTKEGIKSGNKVNKELITSNSSAYKAQNQFAWKEHFIELAKTDPALADQLKEMSRYYDSKKFDEGKRPTRTDEERIAYGANYAGDKIQGSWAGSSTDSSDVSVGLQLAIAKEFSLDAETVRSLKSLTENPIHTTEHSLTLGMTKEQLALIPETVTVTSQNIPTHSTFMVGSRLSETPVMKAYVQKVYQDTQNRFKELGIKEVTLYRGMSDFSFKGETVDVQLNPLSSFSSKFSTANGFGGTVFSMTVPVGRIFSFPRTGPGCTNEKEFTVIGGKLKSWAGHKGSYQSMGGKIDLSHDTSWLNEK